MSLQPIYPLLIILFVVLALLAFCAWQLRQSRGTGRGWRWLRRACMVVCLGGLLLNPSFGNTKAASATKSLDVVFVVDTTSSSAAEDFDGNETRLSGMTTDIKVITEELTGARFSVITFDREATLQLPFTTDATAVTTIADVLEPELTLYSAGSSIDTALPMLTKSLESAQKAEPDRARIVFYMGDGEQTAKGAPKSFSEAGKLVDGGAVLGYGTKDGGKMRERSGFLEDQKKQPYIEDRSGDEYPAPVAISKLDLNNLRRIGKELGVEAHQRTMPAGMDSIVQGVDAGKTQSADTDTEAANGVYWIFGIPLGLLAIWELAVLGGLLAAAPQTPRASTGGGQ